ncbi:50S ribosomal protein L23 [Candidatus Micrarchaeota archaeon]|nr:50S ribosomal protein L23 [Candidatus Micrarchaeota archaeon]
MAKIIHALTTEKAVGQIERENKITLVVEPTATKKDVKAEVEKAYQVKVKAVNMINAFNGKKKAIVSFKEKGAATQIAGKLKVI